MQGLNTWRRDASIEKVNLAEFFDTLKNARRKLAFWCYDYSTVGSHASLGNLTLQQFEGVTPEAIAQNVRPAYQPQTRRLFLWLINHREADQIPCDDFSFESIA